MLKYIYYPEIIVALFFVKELVKDLLFYFNSNVIHGKIIDIDKKEKKGKDKYFPVIEVTDKENNRYQYTHAIGSIHRLKIGKNIKMRKLNNKKVILIKHSGFFNLFYKTIYILVGGLFLLLILSVIKSLAIQLEL